MTQSGELLPDTGTDTIGIRFWQQGNRRDFTWAQFWQMVQWHLDYLDTLPARSGVTLIISHTSPDQMALFVAAVAAKRLPALFPPNAKLQDETAFFQQQRKAFAKIDPSSIYFLESSHSETVRLIDPALGSRTLLLPAISNAAPAALDTTRARARFRAQLHNPDPIFVQHSSGTTGIKKAVAITGEALCGQYQAYWPGLRRDAGLDRLSIASWLPLYHDMGLITSLLLPLLGADTVSIMDAFEWVAKPQSLLTMIEQDSCNTVWLPNFAFRHFIRLRPMLQAAELGSVRLWIDCSEPCRFVDAASFEKTFSDWGVKAGSVLGCYAMAETVFAATQCRPGEQRALTVPHAVSPGADLRRAGATCATGDAGTDRVILSSGRAVPGMEVVIRVLDEPVGEGIYGEVTLRASFLFDSYKAMTQEESNVGEDGFFRTGDLGTLIDGHLYVFGRLKEILIVNGKNLFAGDVEDVLNAITGVKKGRVVAFGLDSMQTGSEELIVVAECDNAHNIPAAQMRQAMDKVILDTFSIRARDIRIVGERWLVKSTSGKISRDENRRKYERDFRGR